MKYLLCVALLVGGCGGNVAASGDAGRSTGGAPGSGGALSGGAPGSGGGQTSGGMPSTGGTGGGCGSSCNQAGFACCSGACAYLQNDPHHCGACGKACAADAPVCLNGQCVAQPCGDPSAALPIPPPTCADPKSCCGGSCCAPNEICCSVHRGGATNGLELGCYDPSQSGGTCPVGCPQCVCASPDTAIATPRGERAIATLAVGDLVYTVDQGAIVAEPIVLVHQQPATHHHVVRVRFSDGSSVEISAPHPTADGRRFGQLRAGDELGGKRISDVQIVPYGFDRTYDILPGSDTGTYFASGALIGSTLGGSASEAAARADASERAQLSSPR